MLYYAVIKRDGLTDMCCSMDEPQNHHAKWNKHDKKTTNRHKGTFWDAGNVLKRF